MEPILLNILTVGLNRYVNTGDRILDNALIGLVMLCVSASSRHLYNNGRRYYNKCVMRIFKKYDTPWDLSPPYWLELSVDERLDNFVGKLTNQPLSRDIKSPKQIKLLMEDLKFNSHPEIQSKLGKTTCNILRLAGFADDGSQVYVDNDGCFYAHGSPSLYFFYTSLAKKIAPYKEVETDEYINSKELQLQVPANSSGRFVGWKRVGGINPRKTFDGLFFDQKKTLVDLLQRFKKQALYPANVPMANKLGILLYGPPGTGKTGTISAIANILGRHVCMVDFTKIQTREDLDAILNPEIYKKNMFVFDEFDCILDVITDRPASVQTENTDWGTLLLSATGDERKAILEAMKAQQSKPAPIDLGYLLQKLDGLESAEDRIIVATTNHPEKLHPALVRPGRFDLKLCLGNCSTSMYVDIISMFYENDETIRAKVAAANIPERKHSPLTVINAALQERDIDHLLDALLE